MIVVVNCLHFEFDVRRVLFLTCLLHLLGSVLEITAVPVLNLYF